jgi:hypothetical protein
MDSPGVATAEVSVVSPKCVIQQVSSLNAHVKRTAYSFLRRREVSTVGAQFVVGSEMAADKATEGLITVTCPQDPF